MVKITAENIRVALSKNLPGPESHLKMLPKNRVLAVPPSDRHRVKFSSVLLLIFEEKNELTACLIKRPKHMKHHAGQIALPGGRIEPGESALQTALRETEEEIGIQPDCIEILGSLSDFYIEVSQFQVHPFVGWLQEKPYFTLNPNEVDKVVLFPFAQYKKNIDAVKLETMKGKITVPCVQFENEIIWGATAMILSEFTDLLISEQLLAD